MTHKERDTWFIQIENVLQGKTADGHLRPGHSPSRSFQSLDAKRVLSHIVRLITTEAARTLDETHRTALIQKVIAHFQGPPEPTVEDILQRSAHVFGSAKAIADNPSRLLSDLTLAQIVITHRNNRKLAPLVARFDPAAMPPRRILWQSPDHTYRFEEATHPSHLHHDTLTLGHCVGHTHDLDLLIDHNLSMHDPAADAFLIYWLRIKRRASRIITFTRHGQPLATMEYDIKASRIAHIETTLSMTVTPTADYFPSFCRGLHALTSLMPIREIACLPAPPPDFILTAHGTFEEPRQDNLPLALYGYLSPGPADAPDTIARYCATPRLRVDITNLTRAQLAAIPPLVAAAGLIFASRNDLHIPHVEHADITAFATFSLSLPQHRTGTLFAPKAVSASVPAHQRGPITLPRVNALSLPRHQQGGVAAPHATTLFLPVHEAGSVAAPASQRLIAPNMRNGNISTSATSLYLPAYRAGNVHAPLAKFIDAPLWKHGKLSTAPFANRSKLH